MRKNANNTTCTAKVDEAVWADSVADEAEVSADFDDLVVEVESISISTMSWIHSSDEEGDEEADRDRVKTSRSVWIFRLKNPTTVSRRPSNMPAKSKWHE